MKYHTDTISPIFAEKLKEKGMPIKEDIYLEDDGYWEKTIKSPGYAEVFDWMMSENRQITIVVEPSFYEPYLGKVYSRDGFMKGFDGKTWHEAADAAIEKALTLI